MSQKPMQLGSPNVTQKCSTVSPGNTFILGSKGQQSRSRESQNSAGVGYCALFIVSAGFFCVVINALIKVKGVGMLGYLRFTLTNDTIC